MQKTVYVVAVFLLGLNSCQKLQEQKVVKIAHGLDVNHSVHKAMVKIGEDLETISKGRMRAEIYPNQQLGTERQCLELLQIGSLDITKVSVGTMENFVPRMKVFGLPFLFRDRKHSFAVMDGPVGKQLLKEGENYRLHGLAYYDAGSRSFYTKDHAVNTPKDLEGLKIRVMESVTAVDMVDQFGGSPTPIAWGELYTALQQGVVDGAENNLPSFYLSRHYEVCKYYTLNEHTVLPDVLIAGTHFWESLNKQQQQWLQQAVDASVAYQRKLWAIAEAKALAEVQKAGVEIIRPNKSLFSEKVKPIYKKYGEDHKMKELIKQIQQIN